MKYVYFFGNGKADGSAKLKELLGGKGSNLHEMTRLGIPVPPGFTISTDVCRYYYENNKTYPEGLKEEMLQNLSQVEEVMNKKFGDPENPLLFSVRSGARVSMPGMMDTILNIGLNDATIKGLIEQTRNPRFAYDCQRRLINMYANVVLKVPHEEFEKILGNKKKTQGVTQDTELTAADWQEIITQYKTINKKHTRQDFPKDPIDQLWQAIAAVFESWNTKRAIEYRRINDIPGDWGTAVNVQAMVFGNMGKASATGVAFTRNPATGENVFYGEWLRNAQGEDVVAGIRTPNPINIKQKGDSQLPSLEEEMPQIYKELIEIRDKLEKHYRDIQDIEFTIENDRLWLLQTRVGKRTPLAAVKIAVEMVAEGLINKEDAVIRVNPSDIDALLHPMIDPNAKVEVIARGLPASPGAASGKVVFTPEEAVQAKEKNEPSILVRFETSAEDIAGMASCEGILTQRGGLTSHASVVARGMGKPCIVGCESISINYDKEEFKVSDSFNPANVGGAFMRPVVIKKGDFISLDGGTGRVIKGEVPKVKASLKGEFGKLLQYADEIRRLGVRTNADNPESARVAREFGAEGIGLCRTEHMFFGEDRIKAMREMILADNVEQRKRALDKLLPFQREDFIGIFREMDGLPVIIRTLDPPLHEFLPHDPEHIQELAQETGVSEDKLREKIASLSEANPMLGHRGCRLGISYPEITEMQARAVFEAACEVTKAGKKVIPEVMIPVSSEAKEIENQRNIVVQVAEEVLQKYDLKFKYYIGTMIEIPRAALTADQIAKVADFFSYGTNDLTQTTFGFSRDDIGKILPDYIKKGILKFDPFQRVDEEGVGALIRIGIEKGRATNPDLEIGICGEHGGEPHSVEFCHRVGMNYVSCSPYRVPVARLAAAQAVIKEKSKSS